MNVRQVAKGTRRRSIGLFLIVTRGVFIISLLMFLAGCAAGGDVRKPIPSDFVAARQTADRLVIVLPGRGDNLASLQDKGVATIIQKAWPDADVILTGLTMPFYRQGRASSRLHDEIIQPARRDGNREIWLLGISLGGMGALLYEHDYPGQIDGLLLFSPYLGDGKIQQEIRDAGGLKAWNPGPEKGLSSETFQRELWRTLKNFAAQNQQKNATWIAYGADEPFRKPIEMVSPYLPSNQILMMPGKHDWSLWIPAIEQLLEKAGDHGASK